MASIYSYSSREGPRRRQDNARPPSFNHNRRSWTDNGAHYSVETANFSTPSLSFGAMGGRAYSSLDGVLAPHMSHSHVPLNVGGALLGTAFTLLNELASAPRVNGTRQVQREIHYSEDEDEDGQYGSDKASEPASRPRSNVFSRVKGKLLHNLEGKQRTRQKPYGRDSSPLRSSTAGDRQQPYRTEERVPIFEQNSTYGRPDKRQQRPQPDKNLSGHRNAVGGLEESVKYWKGDVMECKKRLERASRAPQVDSNHLQSLLNQLKCSEASLASVASDLQLLRDNPSSDTYWYDSKLPRPRRHTATIEEDFIDPFLAHSLDPLFDVPRPDPMDSRFFGTFYHPFAAAHAFPPVHEDLHTFLEELEDDYADVVRRKSKSARLRAGGARGWPQTAYTTPPPMARSPPPNLMNSEEARRLFKIYNDRWNASSTDPDIPYPTRDFSAEALLCRDHIWAPTVTAHPSNWSDETVMQANAQAFFLLNVVGLTPNYSQHPATGAVQMGFDKKNATDAQISQLTGMLKKEKIRWHSDRLGRRNGGVAGTNETLQQDPRARAVFHAVCELMEVAQ